MQSVWSRIWTHVTVSIFYGNNHYTSHSLSRPHSVNLGKVLKCFLRLFFWLELTIMLCVIQIQSLENDFWYLRIISALLILGKGVVSSPTPRCSSYWKGSLRVILNYSRQLYLLTHSRYTNVTNCLYVKWQIKHKIYKSQIIKDKTCKKKKVRTYNCRFCLKENLYILEYVKNNKLLKQRLLAAYILRKYLCVTYHLMEFKIHLTCILFVYF